MNTIIYYSILTLFLIRLISLKLKKITVHGNVGLNLV